MEVAQFKSQKEASEKNILLHQQATADAEDSFALLRTERDVENKSKSTRFLSKQARRRLLKEKRKQWVESISSDDDIFDEDDTTMDTQKNVYSSEEEDEVICQ